MVDARGRLSAAAAALSGAPGAADLLAALPVPSLLINPAGAVTAVNGAAETLFNMGQPAMVGRVLTDIIPEVRELGLTRERLATGTAIAAFDQQISLGGERMARVDLMLAPLPDHPGWLSLAIQNRGTSTLADSRRGRDGAVRAMGAAAMLAHEIKNPLSGIRGAAQLLETSIDAEQADLTRLIRDEVDRIAALIDRMEGFTDTRPMEFAPLNIHAVLNRAREVAAQGFARTIAIREIYDPSLPPIRGNRDALIQLFLNLLKNAAEALGSGAPGDEITLTTAYRHGFSVARDGARVPLPIEICVIDTGPGAPGGIIENLFDPFVSAKPTGTGLGLALVAKLVEDHGGIINYAREGRPERTVLRVLLPRA